MTVPSRQLAKLLIRILIATALLAAVFSQIDLRQFWQTVKTTRWQFLVGVWALAATFFWIRGITLQLILRRQGCHVSVTTLFGASAVTSLYSMVMPGILSTGVKWYILRKNTGKGSNVLSSMLYNQFTLFYVMIVLGLIALILTNPSSSLQIDPEHQWLLPGLCSVLLVTATLVYWFLLSSRTGPEITKVLGSLLKPLPERLRQKGREVLAQIAVFQTAGARFHLTVAAITMVAGLLVGVFMYSLAAKAANISINVGVLLWLCAIVFVLGRIPISVANLGIREVTLVGFLTIYGVEKSAALLMSMILFSALIFMAVIGATYQLAWAITAKRPAPESNL
jgi:uncharacterized membrane protein YbhN (UPF0104 family)